MDKACVCLVVGLFLLTSSCEGSTKCICNRGIDDVKVFDAGHTSALLETIPRIDPFGHAYCLPLLGVNHFLNIASVNTTNGKEGNIRLSPSMMVTVCSALQRKNETTTPMQPSSTSKMNTRTTVTMPGQAQTSPSTHTTTTTLFTAPPTHPLQNTQSTTITQPKSTQQIHSAGWHPCVCDTNHVEEFVFECPRTDSKVIGILYPSDIKQDFSASHCKSEVVNIRPTHGWAAVVTLGKIGFVKIDQGMVKTMCPGPSELANEKVSSQCIITTTSPKTTKMLQQTSSVAMATTHHQSHRCICDTRHPQVPIRRCPSVKSHVSGYMYQQNMYSNHIVDTSPPHCLAIITTIKTVYSWVPVIYNGEISYVHKDSGMRVRDCSGKSPHGSVIFSQHCPPVILTTQKTVTTKHSTTAPHTTTNHKPQTTAKKITTTTEIPTTRKTILPTTQNTTTQHQTSRTALQQHMTTQETTTEKTTTSTPQITTNVRTTPQPTTPQQKTTIKQTVNTEVFTSLKSTSTAPASTTRGHHTCNAVSVLRALLKNEPIESDNANICADGTHHDSEAAVMNFCEAPTTSTWHQGVKVIDHCGSIAPYTPIGIFVGGHYFLHAGFFKTCINITTIQMFFQTCYQNMGLRDITLTNGADMFYIIDW